MQDRSTPESATAGLVRLGLRRVAFAAAGAFAAIALVASLAVAPQQPAPEDTAGDSTTEVMAGPSWGFTAPDDDIKPIPGPSRGTWGPSWG